MIRRIVIDRLFRLDSIRCVVSSTRASRSARDDNERMTDEDERARDGFVRGVGFGFEG